MCSTIDPKAKTKEFPNRGPRHLVVDQLAVVGEADVLRVREEVPGVEREPDRAHDGTGDEDQEEDHRRA